MPDTYPDGALYFADETYFKALAAYERDCRLREELHDGLAEELDYYPNKFDSNNHETLVNYGAQTSNRFFPP